ncbi:MAG: hypothetical protein Q3962_01700 [Corynebacterium sp.]|nr:hypothetical protein [Corynebacterium sp.]
MRKLKLTAAAVAFTTTSVFATSTVIPVSQAQAEETENVQTDTDASTSSSLKSWWNTQYNKYGKWGRAAFIFATAAVLLEVAGFVLGPARFWFDQTFNLTPLSSQAELTLGSSAQF